MSLSAQSLFHLNSDRLNRHTIITYKYSTSDFIQKQYLFSEDRYIERFTGKVIDHHIEYNQVEKSMDEIEHFLARHIPPIHSGIPTVQDVHYFNTNYGKTSVIPSYDNSCVPSRVTSYIAKYTLRFQDSTINISLHPEVNVMTVIHQNAQYLISIKIYRPLRCLKNLLKLPHNYYKSMSKLNADEIQSLRLLGIGL